MHKFEPQGLTAFIVFDNNHLSIHTYPEYAVVKIDVYMVMDPDDDAGRGAIAPSALIETLAAAFGGEVRELQVFTRGRIGTVDDEV